MQLHRLHGVFEIKYSTFYFVFKCVNMTVSIWISGGGYEGLHTLGFSADFQIDSLSRYLFVPH